MNPQIPRSMADDHISELRRQAATAATSTRRDRGRGHSRTSRLRRRIAFAMIDIGSRMLATTQAVTTD